MFFDARKLENRAVIKSDVCIIGAGAAGISMAKSFSEQPFKVCILESGGLERSRSTESLCRGENIGLKYPLMYSRSRCFGGTTSRWAGYCKPIEKNVFKDRPWIYLSGWPFDREELTPYYKHAQRVCKIGPFIYDPAYLAEKDPEFQTLPFRSNKVVSKLFQFSHPPIRFGKTYKKEIEDAKNIDVYLNANVVNIETSENAKVVTKLSGTTLDKNRFEVISKIFILATGGIENARLLLLSSKSANDPGLGNQNDLVGRHFMEHPHFVRNAVGGKIITPIEGIFVNNCKSSCYNKHYFQGVQFKTGLSIAEHIQKKEKLLNISVNISGTRPYDTRELFQNSLGKVILDLSDYKKNTHDGQYAIFYTHIRAEQSPNPDSRVTLSSKRDKLGLRRARLDWRLSEFDIRSISKSMRIIGEEFGHSGLGRVKMFNSDESFWKKWISGGNHHMGTTRMSIDPKKGVVDKNCKIHGISNMYIAGSSVFPTGGSANPTLSIVALSLRLAEYIKNIM